MLQSHQSTLSMKENKTNMKAMGLMFFIIFVIFYSQTKVAFFISPLGRSKVKIFGHHPHWTRNMQSRKLRHHDITKSETPQIQKNIKTSRTCKILNFLVKKCPSVYKFTFLLLSFSPGISSYKLLNCGDKICRSKETKEQGFASGNSIGLRGIKFSTLLRSRGPCFWPIPPSTTSPQLPQFNHLPGYTPNHAKVIKKNL